MSYQRRDRIITGAVTTVTVMISTLVVFLLAYYWWVPLADSIVTTDCLIANCTEVIHCRRSVSIGALSGARANCTSTYYLVLQYGVYTSEIDVDNCVSYTINETTQCYYRRGHTADTLGLDYPATGEMISIVIVMLVAVMIIAGLGACVGIMIGWWIPEQTETTFEMPTVNSKKSIETPPIHSKKESNDTKKISKTVKKQIKEVKEEISEKVEETDEIEEEIDEIEEEVEETDEIEESYPKSV